uniref:G-protein coupled receptors family 1 profile domain-containing protein n=1 Tax=Chrysemys picta bellii TaxID=8478 RepID=A0A8C3ICL7_CHRPI
MDELYWYADRKQVLVSSIHVVSMVIYSIAFVLGVTGNGLVIFITGFRMKRTVNTIWFLNLAVADFIFTFFLPFSVAYTALGFHWPFGRALCKINTTLAFLNLYASVYLLMVISIDRCISVVRPVWAQNHRTPNLALLVALGVWVVALALCSPNLYFRHTAPSPNNENITNCYNNFDTAGEGATEEDGLGLLDPVSPWEKWLESLLRFLLTLHFCVQILPCGWIDANEKQNAITWWWDPSLISL